MGDSDWRVWIPRNQMTDGTTLNKYNPGSKTVRRWSGSDTVDKVREDE